MESSVRNMCKLGFLIVLVIARLGEVNGACTLSPTDAYKLFPCTSAALDANAAVSTSCCDAVKILIANPDCICPVLQSDAAKNLGVDPAVAMTIPKRCNIANRPIGYKCGDYALP